MLRLWEPNGASPAAAAKRRLRYEWGDRLDPLEIEQIAQMGSRGNPAAWSLRVVRRPGAHYGKRRELQPLHTDLHEVFDRERVVWGFEHAGHFRAVKCLNRFLARAGGFDPVGVSVFGRYLAGGG